MLIRCQDTRVQSYHASAYKIFGIVKKRRVPAEKCSFRSIKRVICLKQKHWLKRWVLGTSNRCPDLLSRQCLTTTSTFPYSSKNSSAEHIHAFLYMSLRAWVWVPQCTHACVCVCVCARVCVRAGGRASERALCVCAHACVHVFVYVSEFVCDGETC